MKQRYRWFGVFVNWVVLVGMITTMVFAAAAKDPWVTWGTAVVFFFVGANHQRVFGFLYAEVKLAWVNAITEVVFVPGHETKGGRGFELDKDRNVTMGPGDHFAMAQDKKTGLMIGAYVFRKKPWIRRGHRLWKESKQWGKRKLGLDTSTQALDT